jgi:threonine synthase
VPTGNFGNVYAGYVARNMGLPIEKLVVGSNRNDILTRFFASGEMTLAEVEPTLSPSMDIQISSNFERLLFDLFDRDGARLADAMDAFRDTGRLAIDEEELSAARAIFEGYRFSDDETLVAIEAVHETHGVLIDPHTAVGFMAGRAARRGPDTPLVALATAHPAKFPDAVERATGVRPQLPAHLADLFERPEGCHMLPNEIGALRDHIRARAGRVSA